MSIEADESNRSEPGWYPHPKDKRRRYWNGAHWVELAQAVHPTMQKPESIAVIMSLGVIGAFVGALGLVGGNRADADVLTFLGSVVMAVGYAIMLVAVIAFGVRLGMRHVDWERQERS